MTTLKWLGEHVETIRILKDEQICANCAHFMLHYVASGVTGRMTPTSCGHCVCGMRMKDKNALDRCERFEAKGV